MSRLVVIILAAGEGKRMRSGLPKVLHTLAGRPLLEHVMDAAQALEPAQAVVVYGCGGRQVRERFRDRPVSWVEQPEQRGTGHAVAQAMPHVDDAATVLVLCGDVPLVDPRTLSQAVSRAGRDEVCIVSASLDDPSGYGRIQRAADGRVVGIVEDREASAEERANTEVNTGILAAPAGGLRRWLAALDDANVQGELYLTDVVALAVKDGIPVHTVSATRTEEVLGVNDRAQLAHLERCYQRRAAESLMVCGVTLRDPARVDIRGEVAAGEDVVLDVNVILAGRVVLGDRVSVGPNVVLADVEVGADSEIRAHSVVEGAKIGAGCRIGPFSRIRPESHLGEAAHIGNFVEIKQSEIGARSKVNHLSYVGDSEIGRDVNVGAGTITCNYDGASKHRTVIGDEAFIGSGTELVAPVRVGPGATIGAGSTISKDAPAGKLTLARSRQSTVDGWRRPARKEPPPGQPVEEGPVEEGPVKDGPVRDEPGPER